MCTCVVTIGDTLIWAITQPAGVATAPISFSSADPVGRHSSPVHAKEFTAELTNNTEGQLRSTLNITMLTTWLTISCENPNTGEGQGKNLNVTYSGLTGNSVADFKKLCKYMYCIYNQQQYFFGWHHQEILWSHEPAPRTVTVACGTCICHH